MFVPGNSEKMTGKALGMTNLDVAMFDLEDGVPAAHKAEGRILVREILGSPSGGPRRWVRMNAIRSDNMLRDLDAVVVKGLEGLVLQKIEETDEVVTVEGNVDESESGDGL